MELVAYNAWLCGDRVRPFEDKSVLFLIVSARKKYLEVHVLLESVYAHVGGGHRQTGRPLIRLLHVSSTF